MRQLSDIARAALPSLVVLVLASNSVSVLASGYAQDVADGLEPPTTPLRMGQIKDIVIASQGSADVRPAYEPNGCAYFQMTEKEVLAYFQIARAITKEHYLHTIAFSPCAVRGSITFADGRTGEWGIQKYRGGVIAVTDGTVFHLYCMKRCGKPFRY